MKIDTNDGTIVEGNIDTDQEVVMGISKEAMAHITKLLTNLYNDPQSAVFREYLANALDAHTMAGTSAPVDVYLPTTSTPMFTVKDHGTGMSTQTIREVYSQYGESTKSSANNEIGGFGLGCKSALAISSQFTLISIKDGVRTTAIISNSTDGLAKLNVVDVQSTIEANGTQVAIPISDQFTFNEKAKRYFKFLPAGSIRVEGALNTNYKDTFKEALIDTKTVDFADLLPGVDDEDETGPTTISIFDPNKKRPPFAPGDAVRPGFILVMGGIRYVIPQADIESNLDKDDELAHEVLSEILSNLVVVEAPIGSVKLSPQREGIQFNPPTKKYFNAVFSMAVRSYIEGLARLIEESPSYSEAASIYKTLGDVKRRHVPNEYKGAPLTRHGGLYSEDKVHFATYDRWSEQSRSVESYTVNFSNGNPFKDVILVTGDVDYLSVRRYMTSFIRSRQSAGTGYPKVAYFKNHLSLSSEATHEREVKVDAEGEEYHVFKPLTDEQMEVVLGGFVPTFITYETLKKEALAYRRSQKEKNPDAKRSKTKYVVLKGGNLTFTEIGKDELDIDDDAKVLYLEVTKESHEGVFNHAVYCSSTGNDSSISAQINDLIQETHGNYVVVLLTSGRKPEPLLRALKSRGIKDVEELDMTTIYDTKIDQIAEVTEEMYINYRVAKEGFLSELQSHLDDLEDEKLVEVLSTENYTTVRNAVTLYGSIPHPLKEKVTGVVKDMEEISYWRFDEHPVGVKLGQMKLEISRKYPLINHVRSISELIMPEVIFYLNAKHEESGTELFTSTP